MKFNKWTVALAAIGVVSLASAARADEQPMQMNAVQTALANTTISGYVDTAATWRPSTDRVGSNPGPVAAGSVNTPAYSFSKNDGFSLNAVDIALDKPEDESPWASGYHVELMYGSDAVGETLGSSGAAANGTYASTTIRSAYLRLRTPVGNGIDWQIGIWDTIIGYESSSDPLNPNYTRSYGYSIEPTTHTGILGTYKINDMVTVQAGIADSSNVGAGTIGVNPNSYESQKAYMGSVAFTAPDSAGFMNGATFYMGVIDMAGNGTPTAVGNTSFYAGATLPTPNKALKAGIAFDYVDVHNGGTPGNSANDSVYNIALYSSYQASDKLTLNLRAEYLSNEGALPTVNTASLANGAPPAYVNPNFGAAEEFTATAQYQLWANVISRLEFRWDHVEHGNSFGYGNYTPANPYGVDRANDFLLALNLIYQF